MPVGGCQIEGREEAGDHYFCYVNEYRASFEGNTKVWN